MSIINSNQIVWVTKDDQYIHDLKVLCGVCGDDVPLAGLEMGTEMIRRDHDVCFAAGVSKS